MLARGVLFAFLAAAILPASSGAAASGPVLLVRAGEEPTVRADDDVAIALALASLPPEERARVLDRMRYATTRLEARLSPFGVDLGDEDVEPVDELRQELAADIPAITAARAFEQGAWQAPGLSVRVARSCADARPDERCAPLWSAPSDDRVLARARFVAWSADKAAVVETDDAEALARDLRKDAMAPSSPIALVLTRADLELRPVPERGEIEDAARLLGRAMAASDSSDETHLDGLAHEAPKGRAAAWLDVGARAVVVVPRLSAFTHAGALGGAIERGARGRSMRWVHRP